MEILWVLAALLLAGTGVNASKENPLASVTEDQSDGNYRLPNETYPEHYDLKLTTKVDEGERSFQGEVIIDIVVVNDTNRIVLHSHELEIINVTIQNVAEKYDLEQLKQKYDAEREFLILTRPTDGLFTVDKKYKLTINYKGELRDDGFGFYMHDYTDEAGNKRYLAVSFFESINARHGFPCYDEPSKRANFTITINHNSSYIAVSNMPVNEQVSGAGKTVFQTTDRIPTYLVAFVICDFEFSEGVFGGIKSRVYSRASKLELHDLVLTPGMLLIKHLSEYLGIKFMLPKIDYISIPGLLAAGLEHYGLVHLIDEYILIDSNNSLTIGTNIAVNTVGHELAHQWFGGLITMQWWSYLWLKEGFATFLAYKAMDNVYPEWYTWNTFHTFEYQTALSDDADKNAEPMTFYIHKSADIEKVYGDERNAKAASVLHMWNNALTEKVFKTALHNFLIDNRYEAVTDEALYLSFEKAVKDLDYTLSASIREMLVSWTHQSGYPLLTVTRNYTDGSFTIKQEAYYNDETFNRVKTWYIPINYAQAADSDFRNTEATHYLLKEKKITISAGISKNDWLMLNKQSSGYYRINYDARNWELIIKSLVERPSVFHFRNRAQFMDDAYKLSLKNLLGHETVLGLLSYLKQEDQYAPWVTANSIIHDYLKRLRGHDNYDDLKFFIAQQVGPVYRKFGAHEVHGEPRSYKYTRGIIHNLACGVEVEECLRETNNKLKDLVTKKIRIENDLIRTLYCNGLRQSDDEIYDSFYRMMVDTADSDLRPLLISALGCSQNEKQLKKLLNIILEESNGLNLQERLQLLQPTYSHGEIGLKAAIEFLNNNWIAFGNVTSDTGTANPLDSEMRNMASYIVNRKQKTKYLALLAKVKSHERVSVTLESDVLQTIASNFDWIKENGEPIMKWVSNHRFYIKNIKQCKLINCFLNLYQC